jgi:hypothetical protein
MRFPFPQVMDTIIIQANTGTQRMDLPLLEFNPMIYRIFFMCKFNHAIVYLLIGRLSSPVTIRCNVSIHVVDAEYDTGPVIAQTRVSVEPTDTPEKLAERVLQREHTFFPETLQRIVTGELSLPIRR